VGSTQEETVKNLSLATPWNQMEAGMAVMLGMPVFVICERGMAGGIFDVAASDHHIYRLYFDEEQNSAKFLKSFADWCAAVREQNRAS
jgi:hypothetical protein